MIVAVLGTGIMGAPMARNLASAGHEVRAWNRTSAKAQGLGATVFDSPAGAVKGAEVVITMLADGPTVAAVMQEAFVSDDALWWQASTVGVDWADALGDAYVDGPVMGTRKPAEDGKLTVLASGPGREQLGDVFDAVAAKVIDLGDEVGAGQRMKLVGNSWVLGLVEALAETIALAEHLGVDPRDFLKMIEGGLMDTPYARLKGEPMIAREFPPSFPLALAAKDAGLIVEAAPDLPLPKLVRDQMLRAVEAGHGESDVAATFMASWREHS
ncbi:NAD(P)-dependent oxidoreductase [Solirubrobacter phytolaccae]|uniref:NAD(P)-dependent oxidoreductase n=1 Tax=Solirubrobacter phytolaccae TaxID=1404360 RepID=A0A9X3S5K7_9ACTN|nr:NAD(P)-dependent oxidoreductase [Solirubrobacter phytolaccae]MDA0179044.1 NAD(P)-dependent oxidoreductase [Solirubrobacter phytolaccae]